MAIVTVINNYFDFLLSYSINEYIDYNSYDHIYSQNLYLRSQAGKIIRLVRVMRILRLSYQNNISSSISMAMASKGHLSLTNKGMKTSGPPSSFVKLFHKKKTFFLLQMNASLGFQVSGACSALNF